MNTLKLAQDLIKINSITPNDKGCQELMIKRLKAIDFQITRLKFGNVDNFWAIRGDKSPVFVFAGHSDVVPVGDEKSWKYPPFSAKVEDGILYGRGAADMKGSLAAMVTATEKFIKKYPDYNGSIAFLITSDEEGEAVNGTIKVCEFLKNQKQKIDYSLVAEPSSVVELGDTIKNGRRGSLNGKLKIFGKQGHIAYPHLADNPIHAITPALNDLINKTWDNGNDYFPKTSFQISNINAGTGVSNVIPATIDIVFNFRYSSELTQDILKAKIDKILNKYNLKYEITWQHSGDPFLTPKGDLVTACAKAIKNVKNIDTKLSTSGGTSDGRFIAPILNAQVIELGPINKTIHQVNECVSVQDLQDLSEIYYQTLENIFN